MIIGRSLVIGWRRNGVDPVSIISWLVGVEPEMVCLLAGLVLLEVCLDGVYSATLRDLIPKRSIFSDLVPRCILQSGLLMSSDLKDVG